MVTARGAETVTGNTEIGARPVVHHFFQKNGERPVWARFIPSWNDPSLPVDLFLTSHQKVRRKIVLLANVLEQFLLSVPSHVKAAGPCLRVSARIIDRHFILQCIEVGTCQTFDQMKTVGIRQGVLFDSSMRVR